MHNGCLIVNVSVLPKKRKMCTTFSSIVLSNYGMDPFFPTCNGFFPACNGQWQILSSFLRRGGLTVGHHSYW